MLTINEKEQLIEQIEELKHKLALAVNTEKHYLHKVADKQKTINMIKKWNDAHHKEESDAEIEGRVIGAICESEAMAKHCAAQLRTHIRMMDLDLIVSALKNY